MTALFSRSTWRHRSSRISSCRNPLVNVSVTVTSSDRDRLRAGTALRGAHDRIGCRFVTRGQLRHAAEDLIVVRAIVVGDHDCVLFARATMFDGTLERAERLRPLAALRPSQNRNGLYAVAVMGIVRRFVNPTPFASGVLSWNS